MANAQLGTLPYHDVQQPQPGIQKGSTAYLFESLAPNQLLEELQALRELTLAREMLHDLRKCLLGGWRLLLLLLNLGLLGGLAADHQLCLQLADALVVLLVVLIQQPFRGCPSRRLSLIGCRLLDVVGSCMHLL